MGGSPPVLRPLEPADLPALSDLWVSAWTAAYPDIDFEARRAWFADHLAALGGEGASCVVAVVGNRIAGLVTIGPRGYLDQLVVGREHQGRGVARALLAYAQRAAPGEVTLDVNQDNVAAIRFYRREGFMVVGESRNPRGAPILRMRWTPTMS